MHGLLALGKGSKEKKKNVIIITTGGEGWSVRVDYHFLFFVPIVLKIISRH